MNAIADDTTLGKIGGSLGTAISDGDRRFIQQSNIGTDAPGRANQRIAQAAIAALQRRKDYLYEFGNAEAEGNAAQFQRDWRKFAESTPIVQRDANGIRIMERPITYQEWRASRRRFDANGNEIK